MGTRHPEVDRYLLGLPAERRKALRALRQIVHQTVPNIAETMDYRMPTFRAGEHVVCSLAAQKHHMSLYFCGDAVLDPFQDELEGLDCGSACVRFTSGDDLSPELVRKIVARAFELASIKR